MYLLIIVLGVLNTIYINSRLINIEDIRLTADNIAANEFLFRLSIFGELILYTMVIILSVLLYIILKKVNRNLALLAMVFRTSEALLGIITVLISFIILSLLNSSAYTASVDNTQLNNVLSALLNARVNGLYIILFLVGLGGTLFLFLFYKSFFIPRTLSIWGMFTYVSMLILSLLTILFPESPDSIKFVLYGMGTLFEITIGCWLLFKGISFREMEEIESASYKI